MMRKKKKMKKKRKKEKPGEALKKSRHEGGSIGEGRSKVDALSYWYQSCVDISDSLGCKPPLPVADGYPRASADRWLGLVARPGGAARQSALEDVIREKVKQFHSLYKYSVIH